MSEAIFALWRLRALLAHPRLHAKYLRRMRRLPDVARPREFSERMLWRKLFDRNPLFPLLADKLAAKEWIAARCPGLPIPATLWQGEDPAAIPRHLLRPGVIVKANHGSNFALPIGDPPPPFAAVVAAARRWLATSWGRRRGEWHYAHIPRRIFLEEWVGGGTPVVDIQVRAGGGRVGLCSLCFATKTPAQTVRFLDPAGNTVPDTLADYAEAPAEMPLPAGFPAAVAAARRLSAEVDFARFDFLAAGDGLWAGEITLFPAAGYAEFAEPARSLVLGVWDLRHSWFLREGAQQGGPLTRAYAAALRQAIAAGAA
jgi:hypothetical protein